MTLKTCNWCGDENHSAAVDAEFWRCSLCGCKVSIELQVVNKLYAVTLLLGDDVDNPTFFYDELELAMQMATEIVKQGYLVQIEKVN